MIISRIVIIITLCLSIQSGAVNNSVGKRSAFEYNSSTKSEELDRNNGKYNDNAGVTDRDTTTQDDSKIMLENIRDIAYYLRSHKFNEYDRRYETDPGKADRIYYSSFPRPPLRSLHWEVHQFCVVSFRECVDYLSKRIRYTSLKRAEDTSVVMLDQRWTWRKNQHQIELVDLECLRNKRIDDTIADPFEGPLERFQWRVTASYYMCWYTLMKTPEMKRLYEKCDNFANCLDYDFGPRNDDDRVEDWSAFSCALYSFCPDPCCPFRYLNRMRDCWDSPKNPCFRLNSPKQRTCSMNMSENTNFNNIILNRWNVSCRCPHEGYEWNSRYGICIDVDECASKAHNCERESEGCFNLPGSFRCICGWGYIKDKHKNRCLPSQALSILKLNRRKPSQHKATLTLWQKFKNIIFRRNNAFSMSRYKHKIYLLLLPLITLLV